MEYSLSSIEKTLLSSQVGCEEVKKCRESIRERWTRIWDTASHIFVALFATAALAGSLAVFEHAVSAPQSAPEGISRSHLIGLAPSWHDLLGIPTAHAAGGYDALIVNTEPSSVHLQPDGSARVQIHAKNIGTETWESEGDAYVSLYTYEPKYHVSPYRGPSWWNDHQTGKLLEQSVAPGQTGTVEFFVYAPPGFEGELVETFRLAAEDVAWFEGGTVSIKMTITSAEARRAQTLLGEESEKDEAAADDDAGVVDADSTGYEAKLLVTSAAQVRTKANQPISFKAIFENTGDKLWRSYELHSAQTALAADTMSIAYHPTWASSKIALARSASIAPGSTEMVEFIFRSPATAGNHTVRFQLVANGVEIPGGVIEIPVEVTSNAASIIDAPARADLVVLDGTMIDEPRVRIGIDTVESEAIFSADAEVRVLEGDERIVRATVPAGQAMRVAWNGTHYVYESAGEIMITEEYLYFEGGNGRDTIFTVSSFSDVRSWNTIWNDNKFRDSIEIRHNDRRDRTWIINELPIDDYLYGLDETSGNAPEAYLQALVTAARTFAMYNWEHKTKYAGEFIDMKNTAADQVYHGYNAEVRRPSVIKAVDDTAGVTIQYAGETIVASYFSRSDGRTRDWADVWGRDVPYAKSVAVPCEVGKVKWGHGVGMSAGGALCMANDGSTYDEILKYFYTGVDLVRRWSN